MSRGGYQMPAGKFGYVLYSTGWRILRALLGGPLFPAEIEQASGIKDVTRELLRLCNAEHVDELTTRRYRIADTGRALANRPCPGSTTPKPRRIVATPPAAAPGEPVSPLTPGERAALEAVAAHEGKSIVEIAAAVGRTGHSVRNMVSSLSVRGLVSMPRKGGLQRVPQLTTEGRARLAKKDPLPPRFGRTYVPPMADTAKQTQASTEALVPASFERRGGIRHPSLDSLGFKPTATASASIAGWT